MRIRLAIILTVLTAFGIGFINVPTAFALPGTGVSISGASDVLIGTSPVPLTITFDNTAPNGAGNIGYAPFLDVYFPASGIDGATAPVDGLDYIPLSATYLGEPVTETVLTFPAGPLGGACAVTESAVAHPYLPVSVCGQPGDTLAVFLLPLASLTPDQPPVVLELNSSLSNFADADVPLTVYARGGYRYDAPVAGNPFLSDATLATMTDNPAFSITPRIVTLTKTSTVTESETVTGPNTPHTYTITTTVADGQTISNYDIFDYIDDNIIIVGVVAPGAGAVTLGGVPAVFPAGPVLANGIANRLVISYPSISGTVSATIAYIVPLLDASGVHVITPNNGASTPTDNRLNSAGDFDPLDPRDPAGTNNALAGDVGCPACLPTISQTNRAMSVQKSVVNLSSANNTPGDILQYTLTMPVSDFFALDNVDIFDVISDGQRITGNPTFSYTQHGVTDSGAVVNFQTREYFTGGAPGVGGLPDTDVLVASVGDTVLAIDISAELALNGFNEILGGCVPVGGTGAGNPDCNTFNGGATTLTITYQTTIQDSYTNDFPSGDDSVDMTDTLDNLAHLEVDTVLNTTNLAPTGVGSAVSDTSTISFTSTAGSFTKEIIAVNEVSVGGVPTIEIGDVVTFRLRMTLPSSDFENLAISDFLPAPIFNALEMTTFNNLISNGSTTVGTGIPAAGQAMWGATGANNFANLAGAFTPTIVTPGGVIPASCGGGTIDANENTLMFCFGDYDSLINVLSTIDILFSVTMTANPFPLSFVAGNLARTSLDSTQTINSTFDDLTRMILGMPLPTVTATKTIDGTSEAHTDDGTADTFADPRPVAIGEVITYRLVIEMPEGASAGVQFTDTLATNIELIAGSARISYSANNAMAIPSVMGILNEINPTTTVPAPLISFGVTGPRELRFDIGSVTNNDVDGNVSAELLIIEYQVVVVNTSDSTIGAVFGNDFEVDLNNDSTDEGVSNEVFTIVQEPVISLIKSINTTLSDPTGTTSFDAGDTVVYDIVVTPGNGANMTTAFDLQVTDGIDPNLDLIDVDFIGTPFYATTADNSDYAMPVQTVDAIVSELRTGDFITIRVTTTVRSTVTIGQIIPNTGTATWTSLPGNQGTGNATPGVSGDTNGERNGNTVGENDYTASNLVNFTVIGTVNTYKSIDGTSEAHTSDLTTDTNADPRPVAVGEVMTYRLVVEVPEGTSPDVQMTDTLATNIEFIAGSARISYSANNAMSIPAVVGILNEINPTTTVPAPLISFGVTGPRELRFDIGQVVNNDTDNAVSAELLIIEYQVVVVNTADNVIGATFANDFEVDLNNDGTDEDVSNEVFSIVQEPVITATKAIFGTPPESALEPVTYDITITAGNGVNQQNAYDLRVLDVLNTDLFLDSVIIQTNPGYVSITADNSTYGTAGPVDIILNRLNAGDSVTIRVSATVLTSVTAGETIGNTATITWTSLPGNQGTGNATPGASGDTNGERNGDTIGENDYTTPTNTVNFTLPSGLPIKTIDATSETDTPETGAGSVGNERLVAVGEIVTYRLETVLPESTTISFRIDDDLPAGLQFVTGSARVSYSANTLPSFNGDFAGILNELNPTLPFPPSRISQVGSIISFDFGSIINNDGDAGFEYIIIEFDAVVLDVGGNTNGLTLGNDFALIIDEGLPTEVITTSNEVFIEIAEPDMTMTKTFTPDVQVRGGATTMTIVVSNLASDGATTPIHDLQVTDILDDWLDVTGVNVTFNLAATTFGSTFTDNSVLTAGFATGVTDDIDIAISGLPIDGVATITLNLAIDPTADPLLLSRTITNTADITGDSLATDITPDDQDRAYSTTATDDLNVVKPTLLVTKTDSIDPVSAGATMSYTVSIQNTGTPNFPATGVIFTDQIPAGFVVTLVQPSQGTCSPILGGILTCNIGTIANGASANVVITGYYPTSTANGTIANNIAYVTSVEGNNGNDGNDTPADNDDERAEEPTTILRQVDVAITKTVDNPAPSEGDTITYTLTIINNGPAQATNVIVTDSLPAGTTFVQFLPISAPCVYAAPTLICTYPLLNVGQSVTVDIEATVDAGTSGTTIPNTASVTITEPEGNLGNNGDDADIAVDGVDLAITKTVDNPTPSESDTITYSIMVENLSTTPATNIIITDNLNTLSVSYASDNSPTVLDSLGATTTYNSATGEWSIGQLNAGASLTLQITATVDAGTSGTTITNNASLTSLTQNDGNSANNTDTATIAIDMVDIEVVKTVVPLAIAQGGSVTYTVTVTNLGTITATGVQIAEDLPLDGVNLTYVSHVASQGTFTVGTPGIWDIGTLTAGQIVTLDLTVTVEIAGGQIINTASLSAINEADANPANNSDTAIITVGANADLSLTKTISDTTPQVGDVILYTLIVTNAGPDSPSAITITDTLPPTVTYAGIHTPSQGTFDGTIWTVGALAVGASAQLDISVTVNGNAGTTTNIAEITASDLPDPDSIVNNGVTTEDDYAEVAFLFDPPFGRKTFNDAGLPELEWTVVWVNPSNAPVPVTMSDPLLGGTTFITGSLTCTSPGTLTVNTCIYDALNNEIVFDGTIFPDVGATPATIDSATNRLIITYRVAVPDSADTVSNVATLTSPDGAVAVATVFSRTAQPPTTPPTTTGGDGELLASVKALPATGETPLWADILRGILIVFVPMLIIGFVTYRRMKQVRG